MGKITLKNWLLATRPWSFAVSGLPAFVAMMYCIHTYPESSANWLFGVLAVIGAVIFHAGGNLISDYNDYLHGVDTPETTAVDSLTSGLFRPRQIWFYGWTFIVVGVVLGLFLVSHSGWGLLWIGMLGFTGAVFYFRFKANALGDFLIFLIYGPSIMLGTGYVLTEQINWVLLFVSLPMVFITVDVLHCNNTRDISSDRSAGIRTFAMLIGIRASVVHYLLLNILSYIGIVVMVVMNILPVTTLITLVTIPIAFRNCKAMTQITETDVKPINNLDKATAQLQLLFSATMSLALIVSIMI